MLSRSPLALTCDELRTQICYLTRFGIQHEPEMRQTALVGRHLAIAPRPAVWHHGYLRYTSLSLTQPPPCLLDFTDAMMNCMPSTPSASVGSTPA